MASSDEKSAMSDQGSSIVSPSSIFPQLSSINSCASSLTTSSPQFIPSQSLNNASPYQDQNQLVPEVVLQAVLAQQPSLLKEEKGDDVQSKTIENRSINGCENVYKEENGLNDQEDNIFQENIRNHPLFGLLKQLLVRCEDATWFLTDTAVDMEPIRQEIERIRSNHNSLRTKDTELDSLMFDAVKVLRIHLMELAKVNDLCKSFCDRYICCIKSRMNRESLIGSTGDDDDDDFCDTVSGDDRADDLSSQPVATIQTPSGSITVPLFTTSSTVKNSDGEVNQDSLPLRRLNMFFGMDSSFDDDLGGKGNGRRSSLPKTSVEFLRTWLFQHVTHPYPSENEKRCLAQQTGLNIMQVNNWFINARRRILQPMLDGGSPDLPTNSTVEPKTKKPRTTEENCTKSNSSSALRYWPFSNEDLVDESPNTEDDSIIVPVAPNEHNEEKKPKLEEISSD